MPRHPSRPARAPRPGCSQILYSRPGAPCILEATGERTPIPSSRYEAAQRALRETCERRPRPHCPERGQLPWAEGMVGLVMGRKWDVRFSASITALVVLMLTAACTADEEDREEPTAVASQSEDGTAESAERLRNRMIGLTDLQGAPLYVVPEPQTRSHLEALAEPPLFEQMYTPAECAPDTAFIPPPAGLEGVLGRSNLSDDRSRLGVEIYTAPDSAELASYFVGDEPESPAQCTEFSITIGDTTQDFSYTSVNTPPVGAQAISTQFSITEDGSTTHYLRVTAVDGPLAASVILSTSEPATQTMTDTVLALIQRAIT